MSQPSINILKIDCTHAEQFGRAIMCKNVNATPAFGPYPSPSICTSVCPHYNGANYSGGRHNLKLTEMSALSELHKEDVQVTGPVRLDCLHRGEQIGERECPSCSGKISLKVFACDIHKQTTIARQVDDLACCATCNDYEGKEE